MFHIAKDKRSKTSAKLVSDALDRCLKEKSYEQITISDVCRESTISRATFYRLFDNMDDVLSYQIEALENEFQAKTIGKRPRVIMEEFIGYWMAQPDFLDIIIRIHREDILYECHRRRAADLSRYFIKVEPTEYHISILTQILISTLTTWAKTGKKESPSEIVDILKRVAGDLVSQID